MKLSLKLYELLSALKPNSFKPTVLAESLELSESSHDDPVNSINDEVLLANFIAAFENERDSLAFRWGLYSGIRVVDVLQLKKKMFTC
ncbi:hypothetical protein GEMRC1_013690 [Eukaryota sp. GEM-RC1]